MVYCEECNKQANQQCKICQLKYFRDGFSENKRIDSFIQEMQLKIDNPWNIVSSVILKK